MDDGTHAQPRQRGRGTAENPANRFDRLELPWDAEWLESEHQAGEQGWRRRTEFFVDTSKSVLSRNDSPDLGFEYSLNAYRGCEHGCMYCYARPSHEYLGFSAGLDFESRIVIKPDAPALLERAIRAKGWQPQAVLLSGNTDCYQPAERRLRLTRGCLEVFLHHGHPVQLITKNALVLRDLDLLQRMAARNLAHVTISITSLDAHLAAVMEPRASAPHKRLEAVAALHAAGVPVGVNTAPLIPGLNDHEAPRILEEAAVRGAAWGNYILVRLSHGLGELFEAWLERHFPERKERVLGAIRQMRGGELNDSRWGRRMRGEGVRADALSTLYEVTCRRLGLNRQRHELSTAHFTRDVPPLHAAPTKGPQQQSLFPEAG
ncbi:MAG TPA: PA0069 family radical SAM protein [bacterium]|nr:PA0069 family radical SAM protein [bacterium]